MVWEKNIIKRGYDIWVYQIWVLPIALSNLGSSYCFYHDYCLSLIDSISDYLSKIFIVLQSYTIIFWYQNNDEGKNCQRSEDQKVPENVEGKNCSS